jgi:hypothetical protein
MTYNIALGHRNGPEHACHAIIEDPQGRKSHLRRTQVHGSCSASKTDTSVRAAHAMHAAPTTAIALAGHEAAMCLGWGHVAENWRPFVAFSMYEGQPMHRLARGGATPVHAHA